MHFKIVDNFSEMRKGGDVHARVFVTFGLDSDVTIMGPELSSSLSASNAGELFRGVAT